MKKSLILFFFVCAGIVVGALVASLAKNVSGLSWLSFGLSFGTETPLILNLGVLTLTLGASFDLSIAVIIFTLITSLVGLYFIKHRR